MVKREIRVFYSWQSDLPSKTNSNAIRKALDWAAARLSTPETKIIVDEATRDTSGSPNIALKILEKIGKSDVLVVDITTVLAGDNRASPNPNVVFELGYGVAELGWERIILLFNTEFGKFPGDLPFDFIQNRVSPFALKMGAQQQAVADLRNLARQAISAVVKKNPKRPAELRGLGPKKIKHERDVEAMKWLMSSLHLPTVDEFINELPRTISYRASWFFENIRGVVVNSLFHVYDTALSDAVKSFFQAWSTVESYAVHYHMAPSGNYIFTNPMDAPLTGDKEVAWNDIAAQRLILKSELEKILERLREQYLEIDLSETNKAAWLDFQKFEEEMRASGEVRPGSTA